MVAKLSLKTQQKTEPRRDYLKLFAYKKHNLKLQKRHLHLPTGCEVWMIFGVPIPPSGRVQKAPFGRSWDALLVDGRNPANQLLSSLSHYLRRVLYIPGGDRRISETSKVPFFKPHLTISNFLAHHFLLKFGIGGGNQQWRRSSQNICQRLSSEIKALGILRCLGYIYFYTYNTLW